MINRYLLWGLVAAVAVGLTHTGTSLGIESASWATWVGAIGTVGTLGGTIYLARSEARRREHSELVLARLHASALLMRLDDAYQMVANLKVQIQDDLDEGGVSPMMLDYALASAKRIKLWTIADLVPLAPLPG